MIYLLLSILFSTSLLVIFKIFEKYRINNITGIVVNYITATTTGFAVSGEFPDLQSGDETRHLPYAILIGTLFVSLFFIVALSSQQNGIAITSVANKMSLVIPVIAAIFLYNEEISHWVIIGIAMALTGVVFTAIRKEKELKNKKGYFLFPLIIFLGSGISDTLLKYVEVYFLKNVSIAHFTALLFAAAAFTGLVIFLIAQWRNPFRISAKDLAGGLLLGVPNYFSIHFLFLAFSHAQLPSSTLIPLNNIGIVICSALAGLLFYRENYSLLNYTGLLLSILAIVLIAFG